MTRLPSLPPTTTQSAWYGWEHSAASPQQAQRYGSSPRDALHRWPVFCAAHHPTHITHRFCHPPAARSVAHWGMRRLAMGVVTHDAGITHEPCDTATATATNQYILHASPDHVDATSSEGNDANRSSDTPQLTSLAPSLPTTTQTNTNTNTNTNTRQEGAGHGRPRQTGKTRRAVGTRGHSFVLAALCQRSVLSAHSCSSRHWCPPPEAHDACAIYCNSPTHLPPTTRPPAPTARYVLAISLLHCARRITYVPHRRGYTQYITDGRPGALKQETPGDGHTYSPAHHLGFWNDWQSSW